MIELKNQSLFYSLPKPYKLFLKHANLFGRTNELIYVCDFMIELKNQSLFYSMPVYLIELKNWSLFMTSLCFTACPDYNAPELFQYQSQSGFTHHGLFFHPHGEEAGKKYPTVVMVYGGPQVQQVTNCFKGIRSVGQQLLQWYWVSRSPTVSMKSGPCN